MEAVKVYIGQVVVMSNGAQQDSRKVVQFEGEKLGQYREYGQGRDGQPTDTRGTIETLYRVSEGRLVVHTEEWSHWQGEPNTETLQEVTERDLQPGGLFEDLGAACGFGRPLTLEEALSRGEDEGSDAAREMEYVLSILNRPYVRKQAYYIRPGKPETGERSLEGNFDGVPLLGFAGSLDKEQKSHFEALGFDFERWNKTVEDLVEQLNWIRENIQGKAEKG